MADEAMSDADEQADWERSGRDRDQQRRDRYQTKTYARNVRREDEPSHAAPVRVKSHGQSARTIVGLMAFTTVFALVATEIDALTGQKPATNGVRIIIGGGVATIILLMLGEAGDAGAQLAEGLALVTTVAAVLVKGKPVWDFSSKLFGTQPTQPTGSSGTGTGVTLPAGAPLPPPYSGPAGVGSLVPRYTPPITGGTK